MATNTRNGATYKKFAFFDVDETVVRFKTMFEFQRYYFSKTGLLPGVTGDYRYRKFVSEIDRHLRNGKPREFINTLYYKGFRGRKQSSVCELVRQWREDLKKSSEPIFVPATLDIIRRHQKEGTKIVLVSGSFIELLEPLAEELGAFKILATRLEVKNGRYTGNILPPQMIGAGKALALRRLLEEEGVSRSDAWAYGDHSSDVAMLEEVDHPAIVSRDPDMMALAANRGWELVDPR